MKEPTDLAVLASPEYRRFMEDLKARVTAARISAARAVNNDLVLLYLDIGRGIVEKQQVLGWGDGVVEMVAADLRRAFPEMRGFSPANVWRMRQLHTVYSSSAFLAQAARESENRGPRQRLSSFPGQPVPEIAALQAVSDGSPILAQGVRELAAAVPWGHHVLPTTRRRGAGGVAGRRPALSRRRYRCQPPTPAKDLLAEFWRLEKEAEKMLEGLAR